MVLDWEVGVLRRSDLRKQLGNQDGAGSNSTVIGGVRLFRIINLDCKRGG